MAARGARLEAGGGGYQRARAAPLRPPPWWQQRHCQGRKDFWKTLRGGSIPVVFLGLMDLTQLSRLEPDSHRVDLPTNRENRGSWSDNMTNGTPEKGRTDSQNNTEENGRGPDGIGGVHIGVPPTTRGEGTGAPRGAEEPRQGWEVGWTRRTSGKP